jgi:uncharacterized glyoxalase superfamily protein PhnB
LHSRHCPKRWPRAQSIERSDEKLAGPIEVHRESVLARIIGQFLGQEYTIVRRMLEADPGFAQRDAQPTQGERTMTTKLKDMVAMLICDDVQASIEFYSHVLGFSVVDRMDTVGKSGWASMNCGTIQLMLASPDYIPEPQKSEGRYSQAMYYFYPEDIETLHAQIRQSGYEVTELQARFYGMREFEMLDPSGHVLVFGQETDEQSSTPR